MTPTAPQWAGDTSILGFVAPTSRHFYSFQYLSGDFALRADLSGPITLSNEFVCRRLQMRGRKFTRETLTFKWSRNHKRRSGFEYVTVFLWWKNIDFHSSWLLIPITDSISIVQKWRVSFNKYIIYNWSLELIGHDSLNFDSRVTTG